MLKGEFTKFYQHDGCVGCFSHLEEGLEEPSVHNFNNLYFLGVHPNFTGITCCGMHQCVEEVTF
jgi:hypothetical protein